MRRTTTTTRRPAAILVIDPLNEKVKDTDPAVELPVALEDEEGAQLIEVDAMCLHGQHEDQPPYRGMQPLQP